MSSSKSKWAAAGAAVKMASSTRNKRTQRGIPFNLMVVGQSGLGKSTFVKSLVGMSLSTSRDDDYENDLSDKTVELIATTEEIEEEGQRVILTVVDTPGFGDNIDNSKSFKRVLDYVETQFKRFLAEESRVQRNSKFQDTRVHAIVYFIPPTGHSLRDLDILFLKQLGRRCSIIPVIAKSDSLLPNEMKQFKARIMEDIKKNEIPIFDFPSNSDDDEEIVQENEDFKASLPFSIIASDKTYDINGHQVLGRKYPWGTVDVTNEKYSDFTKIKTVLFVTHFEAFRELANDKHYENFRQEYLSNLGTKGVDGEKLETELAEQEKQEKERREREKEEREKKGKKKLAHTLSISSQKEKKEKKEKEEEDGEKKKKKKDKDRESRRGGEEEKD